MRIPKQVPTASKLPSGENAKPPMLVLRLHICLVGLQSIVGLLSVGPAILHRRRTCPSVCGPITRLASSRVAVAVGSKVGVTEAASLGATVGEFANVAGEAAVGWLGAQAARNKRKGRIPRRRFGFIGLACCLPLLLLERRLINSLTRTKLVLVSGNRPSFN